jgi:hypothetical protein
MLETAIRALVSGNPAEATWLGLAAAATAALGATCIARAGTFGAGTIAGRFIAFGAGSLVWTAADSALPVG